MCQPFLEPRAQRECEKPIGHLPRFKNERKQSTQHTRPMQKTRSRREARAWTENGWSFGFCRYGELEEVPMSIHCTVQMWQNLAWVMLRSPGTKSRRIDMGMEE